MTRPDRIQPDVVTADARTTDPVAWWKAVNADRYEKRLRAERYAAAMKAANEAGDHKEWVRLALEYNEVTR